MEDILKLINQDTFAMLVAIFVLVRLERALGSLVENIQKSMKSLEDKIENKMDSVEQAISKTNKLMALLIFKNNNINKIGEKEIQEVICIEEREKVS